MMSSDAERKFAARPTLLSQNQDETSSYVCVPGYPGLWVQEQGRGQRERERGVEINVNLESFSTPCPYKDAMIRS